MHIPIFGNGDIDSPEKALLYKNRYGVDGIMIGRASIGHPWIFREIKHYLKTGEILDEPTMRERVNACNTHFEKSIQWKGERVGIVEMRRHYANYFKGLSHFKEYRMRLVQSEDVLEIQSILNKIVDEYAHNNYLITLK
jgi:tRNA-dihydrouridine synthase